VRAVAPRAPVVFGGPGKTDSALAAAAADGGVAAVHVESVHELRRAEHVAAGLGVTLPVARRVNLAGPLPVATLAMAGRPTPFGPGSTPYRRRRPSASGSSAAGISSLPPAPTSSRSST